jgi:hypothetical protein
VVFDDAIVDDRDAIACIEVRMGVDLARTAVGGPAGVCDPDTPGCRILGETSFKPADFTDRATKMQLTVINSHHPRGVISTILQPLQSIE